MVNVPSGVKHAYDADASRRFEIAYMSALSPQPTWPSGTETAPEFSFGVVDARRATAHFSPSCKRTSDAWHAAPTPTQATPANTTTLTQQDDPDHGNLREIKKGGKKKAILVHAVFFLCLFPCLFVFLCLFGSLQFPVPGTQGTVYLLLNILGRHTQPVIFKGCCAC